MTGLLDGHATSGLEENIPAPETVETFKHEHDLSGLNDAIADNAAAETGRQETGPAMPEGLDPRFWDAETGQVKLADLITEANRAKGLRDKLAKGGEDAPANVEGYEFAAPEGYEFGEEDAPLLQIAAQLGVKYKLNQETLNGLLGDFIVKARELDAELHPELTPEQEAQAEAERVKAEFNKIGPNASVIAQSVNGWLSVMERNRMLEPNIAEWARNNCNSAEALLFMNAVRQIAGVGDDIPANTGQYTGEGLKSDAEIHALLNGSADEAKEGRKQLELRRKLGIEGTLKTDLK